MPGISTPRDAIQCGPGTKLDKVNRQCIADGESGITCGPGTALDATLNQCLPASSVVTCGPGTVQAPGKVCVPEGTEVSCGPGTVLQGDTCVAGQEDPNKPVTCGPGTQIKDGACVPAGGSAPDIKCGPGLEKVNNVCQLPAIALTCGPGTVEVDRVCVADENNGGNGIKCGPGTVLEGTKCVVGVKNPAQPITCGPGTKKEGDTCVPDGSGATISCAPPLVLEGKECVQATKVTCGPGTVQVDNVCVADGNNGGNGVKCGPGTFLQGTTCVVGPKQDGVPLSCGPGTRKEGDTCVPDGSGATISCGPDTIQQGDACIPKPSEVTCGPGTVEVDKICVAAPGSGGNGVTCGPDTVLQGNTCVPGSKPPASQPLQCGPGTTAVNGVCTPDGSDGSILCGPGAVLEGKQCVTALVCGPGTREVDRVCVPDAQNGGNDVSCGPGTVLFGVTCILGDKPDPKTPLSCGAETQPVDDLCKPTGNGGAITCGQGTKLEGKLCVPVSTDADPLNCGKVGNVCPGGNGTPTCIAGVCGIKCNEGFGNCDGNLANGCETSTAGNDASNCGGCGTVCPGGANSSATCTGGVCGIACQPGFGNCDGQASNGCEVNLINNANSCGVCGNFCTDGFLGEKGQCIAGICQLECPSGKADCDGKSENGCEINILNDKSNCGICGNDCGAAGCDNGRCGGVALYQTANAYSEYQFDVHADDIFFINGANLTFSKGNVNGVAPEPLMSPFPSPGTPYVATLVDVTTNVASLIIGNTNATIFDLNTKDVSSVPFVGSFPMPLAIESNRFFFGSSADSEEIFSVNKAGEQVKIHVEPGISPSQDNSSLSIVRSGSLFYWTKAGELRRQNLGSGAETILWSDPQKPTSIRVTADLVWVAFNGPTRVFSMGLDGSGITSHPALEALANQQDVGYGIDGITSYKGVLYASAFNPFSQNYCAIMRYDLTSKKANCIGSWPSFGGTIFATEKWIISSGTCGSSCIVRTPRW
ncbi:MAG: hypothetical protein MUF64_06140 [Polyangiaceae bacterium]|nr:hypothetical protein [Polyangiaceae bacterium]